MKYAKIGMKQVQWELWWKISSILNLPSLGKNQTLPLEMIHQDSNQFSDSTLVGWLFAEEADN